MLFTVLMRRSLPWFVLSTLPCLLAGCSSSEDARTTSAAPQSIDSRPPSTTPAPPKAGKPKAPPATVKPAPPREPQAPLIPQRSFSELVTAVETTPAPTPPPTLPQINDAEVRSLGIRKMSGKHVAIYTDLPSGPEIDELPTVFDAAVSQWCEYFAFPLDRAQQWRIIGYLMQEKDRFERAGLLPNDLPEFLHGYTRGSEFWMHEQPSSYYRRHLMLHEGTHAFMSWALKGAGPPWYMEGMAELLATHRWRDGQLSLRYFPKSKDEVPEWGRIKIIQDDYRAGRAMRLGDVFEYDAKAHLRLEPYGWCWAAATFLDNHPSYRERFRNLRAYAHDSSDSFSVRFLGWFAEDSQLLWREWQWFIVNLDYGYQVELEAIQSALREPLTSGERELEVAAGRGWQSTGILLEADKKYHLEATGRFQIANQPKIWWCEPRGVTVRYHRGLPLGILLAAIVDEEDPKSTDNGFLEPIVIGAEADLTPAKRGTLYLRMNDLPSELSDNDGSAKVKVVAP